MRFAPRLLGLGVIGALMLSACGSASTSPGPGGGAISSAGNDAWGPAKPMTATMTLDNSKASSALISVRGGTLSTTGSDGSKFTLAIPDRALGGDEKITMTPIQAMNGLPVAGGLVAGIQLEPDGLQLFRMATLTITPARQLPPNYVAMSHHGTGDNLHLHPLDPVKAISVHILHFSGIEVVPATDAELKAMADRRPRDAADQAAQEVASQRYAALKNPGTDVEAALEPVYKRWFENVVVPKLNAAIANYTLADDAVANALAWRRDIQLRGGEQRYASQAARMDALMAKLIEAVHKGLVERCIKGHDISAVVPLIQFERQQELVGEGIGFQALSDELRKCLRFELDFETITPFLSDDQFAVHTRVLHLVLQADANLKITGSQAHEIIGSIDVHGMNRRFDKVAGSQPFKVLSLGFRLHFLLRPTPEQAKNALSGVALTVNPGEVTGDEMYANMLESKVVRGNIPMLTCPFLPELKAHICWTARHHKEASEPGPRPVTFEILLESNAGSGATLLARKAYQLPCDYSAPNGMTFDCGTETTTFDLRHAPGS